MKGWTAERLIVTLTLALACFTGGYFAGRAAATPDGTAAVIVQTQPEPAPPEEAEASAQPAAVAAEPVDLNTADLAALTSLPGIGETLAQRILDYREAHGPFRSAEELLEVSGIGEKRLEAIWDLICVGE